MRTAAAFLGLLTRPPRRASSIVSLFRLVVIGSRLSGSLSGFSSEKESDSAKPRVGRPTRIGPFFVGDRDLRRFDMAEACGSRTHPSRREAATPTDLKSARVTGPRALPCCIFYYLARAAILALGLRALTVHSVPCSSAGSTTLSMVSWMRVRLDFE